LVFSSGFISPGCLQSPLIVKLSQVLITRVCFVYKLSEAACDYFSHHLLALMNAALLYFGKEVEKYSPNSEE